MLRPKPISVQIINNPSFGWDYFFLVGKTIR